MKILSPRIEKYAAGKMPLKEKKRLLVDYFPGKFSLSPGQIDIMLSKKERKRSKLWTNSDYCKAMKIRCLSVRALNYVRKELCPLPAYPTLRAKFGSFMHLTPGFMRPMMVYLSRTLVDLSPYKRLSILLFDDVKITEKGQLDRKLDMIIGANKDTV